VNRDPQLEHRGHFQTLRHEHLGELRFEHYGIQLSDNPRRLRTPGPNLGEHSHEILREQIGMTADEVEALVASGVLV
jgi:crotonobetainyl-CoA:carnitine CoA-transferase CaiB-like acyl-CoA transferase